jgi:hypothetical protein
MLLASTTLANIASEFGSIIFYPLMGHNPGMGYRVLLVSD